MANKPRTGADRRKKRFKNTSKPLNPRNRLIGLLAVFLVVACGFIAVLVDLQAVRSDEFRSIGESQRTGKRTLDAKRGSILDRTGYALAASVSTDELVADPKLISNSSVTASLLEPVIGMEFAELEAALIGDGPDDRYSLLVSTIDEDAAAEIRRIQEVEPGSMKGIFLRSKQLRTYPAEELGVSLVGRVDPDEVGVFGVEYQFDEIMTGAAGTEEFERNNFGGSIGISKSEVKPALEGFDVMLTIDHRLQFTTEQILIDHCEFQKAKGATAVVSDPSSGEILAMASVQRNKDNDCVVARYNKAVVDSFEPGSVVKPIVAAAAVEKLGYSADTEFNVLNRLQVSDKTFSDELHHESGVYPVKDIIAESMNVGTIQLAQLVGKEEVYSYFKNFGIGEMSGLNVKGESRGSLRKPEDWWGSDAGSIPIGQGLTTNVLQINSAFNIIANDGIRSQPTLVKSLRSPQGGNLLRENGSRVQVIDQNASIEVKKMLKEVTENGTGTNAKINGFDVAGKTGTAWKVFENSEGKFTYGSDGNRKYVTTFSGFVPVDEPVLSITVMVDEPKTFDTSSKVSAPIFSEIGSYGLNLLGVVPTYDSIIDNSGSGKVRSNPAGPLTLEPESDIVAKSNETKDTGAGRGSE